MQPLDIKVFGALKANERVAFFKIIDENKDGISNKGTHIHGAWWNALSEDLFDSAWRLYQKAVNQEHEQDAVVGHTLPTLQSVALRWVKLFPC